ncbi:MAG: aminopeptidase P N-terminal domain-containing protein [Gammaproteobacteria bacterium]|nr:aminopeptidase P N-terminal domain-containing protein [Gammaproteobacteria bacterium]
MYKEFAKRRRNLMRMIGNDAIAIVPASTVKIRNRDVEFDYRQDSDFMYLTGFIEPEAVAVLVPGRPQAQFILFCRERDMKMETWNGRRAGQQGAIDIYGADDAFPIGDIDEILPGILEQRERVFYTMGVNADFDHRVIGWVNRIREKGRGGAHTPHEFIALEHLLHELRLFKSGVEIGHMKKAAKAAVSGHRRAMQFCQPGLYEYQVEAELLYEFKKAGCDTAYPSIVGGGENGCILHYTDNKDLLNDGDLLLIDAGAEYHGYASDITRTFPVNGEFSEPQRELYDLVLAAQLAAIEAVQPGNHWNDPHEAAVRVLTKGMVKLGLLKGRPAQLIKDGEYRRFYMHRTGHWLGLDVHDVGDYKIEEQWRLFEPGMVLTVEPGIYIPAKSRGVPKRYWDTGIRIEDDVRVTRNGNEVLTQALIKEADAIENFMSSAQ